MLSSHVYSSCVDDWSSSVDDWSSSTGEKIVDVQEVYTKKEGFQKLRKKLKLRDELADYQLCLECVLPGQDSVDNGHNYYQRYKEGSVDEILEARPIWDEWMPQGCHPTGGLLPFSRVARKVQQVNNLVLPARMMIESLLKAWEGDRPLRVVEFCAGSGFVLLPLAKMFPDVDFVLIDYKKKSVEIGLARIESADLQGNVRVVLGDIGIYEEDFELGLGLHACGPLTDIVLGKCYAKRAMFVVAPCCVGKIYAATSLPRSHKMQERVRSHNAPWGALLKAADFGHSSERFYFERERKGGSGADANDGDENNSDKRERGKRLTPVQRNRLRRMCKTVVEEDRRTLALELGYQAHLLIMEPAGASPKNDVLVGWPQEAEERAGTAPIPVRRAQRDGESLESFLLRATFST